MGLSKRLELHYGSLQVGEGYDPLCQRSCRLNRIGTFGGADRQKVARYGQAYKDRIVARLLPPESSSVELVSREVAISVATLERWLADALANGSGAGSPRWTAAARLQAVIVTAAMDEATRSGWCREQGCQLEVAVPVEMGIQREGRYFCLCFSKRCGAAS